MIWSNFVSSSSSSLSRSLSSSMAVAAPASPVQALGTEASEARKGGMAPSSLTSVHCSTKNEDRMADSTCSGAVDVKRMKKPWSCR